MMMKKASITAAYPPERAVAKGGGAWRYGDTRKFEHFERDETSFIILSHNLSYIAEHEWYFNEPVRKRDDNGECVRAVTMSRAVKI